MKFVSSLAALGKYIKFLKNFSIFLKMRVMRAAKSQLFS